MRGAHLPLPSSASLSRRLCAQIRRDGKLKPPLCPPTKLFMQTVDLSFCIHHLKKRIVACQPLHLYCFSSFFLASAFRGGSKTVSVYYKVNGGGKFAGPSVISLSGLHRYKSGLCPFSYGDLGWPCHVDHGFSVSLSLSLSLSLTLSLSLCKANPIFHRPQSMFLSL